LDPELELRDKGMPAQTVDRMEEPEAYLNPIMLSKAVKNYTADFSYKDGNGWNSDYGLEEISADLDERLIRYVDQDNGVYYGFSKNDFDTALVIDHDFLPWTVDTVEGKSLYFNNVLDEFLPAYRPEVVDPLPEISRVWKEAKNELEPRRQEITVEETFNRIGRDVRERTRLQNIRE
jgi:hypothetical protein